MAHGLAIRMRESKAGASNGDGVLAENQRLREDAELLQMGCKIALQGLRQALSETKDLMRERRQLLGAEPGSGSRETGLVVVATKRHTQPDALSRREREVLKAIAEGYSTKQIAEKLAITFKTAACYRYRLMEKLAIHDTASLVRYAIRTGIASA